MYYCVQACLPTFDTLDFSLGAFRLGRQWHGYYSGYGGVDMVLANGNPRMGHGSMSIMVSTVQKKAPRVSPAVCVL